MGRPYCTGVGVAALLAAAGCLTCPSQTCLEPPDNPVRQAVHAALEWFIQTTVPGPSWVPEFCMRGYSGGSRGSPEGGEMVRRYRYEFRCVRRLEDFQVAGKGWLLPSSEYPRIMAVVHHDLVAAVAQAGGKVTHTGGSGSTFEVDYKWGRVEGTIRGRLGPSPLPVGAAPDYKQDYTLLEVDVREELKPATPDWSVTIQPRS
jgi:hypothetical protein